MEHPLLVAAGRWFGGIYRAYAADLTPLLILEIRMPTGYTDGVSGGEITDFKVYALRCAMAFGACVMLRDEPVTDEIPEFEPSDYNQKRLDEAQKQLAEFDAMTVADKLAMFERESIERVKAAKEGIERKREQLDRYNAMLEKAKAFKAPTPDHSEYAKFLVSQLEESIRFDGGGDYYEKQLEETQTFNDWSVSKKRSLLHDIEYHKKGMEKEIERTEKRNKWVHDLKASLGVE